MNELWRRELRTQQLWGVVLTGFVVVATSGCAGKAESNRNTAVATSFQELKLAEWGSQVSSPPGAPCELASFVDTFRVSTAMNELTWDLCAFTPSGVEHQTGSQSLSAADLDSITEAVGKLTPTSEHHCGADARAITIDETTSDGVQLLADDFYSGCPWGPLLGRTFVEGVQTLETTLEALKDQ